MSRHRGIKQMIDDEIYDEQDDDQQEDYDNEYTEEDEELIAFVLDEAGEKFNRDDALNALDANDWEPEAAVQYLLMKGAKKKKSAETKTQKLPDKQVQQQKFETKPEAKNQKKAVNDQIVELLSQEETKQSVTIDNKPLSRKGSEEINVPKVDSSIYIDKTKFNIPYPDMKYDLEKLNIRPANTLYAVIIGHVDSGKSTLVGHLLYLLGEIDKNLMHKYEKESQNMGKGSFKFAWVMDERDEERRRGITIDVGMKTIQTKSKKIILLDAPGHKDYVPNMISGAAQADVAVLVIDSVVNAFEAGFSNGGQTQEHAILAKSMGIDTIVVAVNKLDLLEWSKDRYEYVLGMVVPFLTDLGFTEDKILCLPISGTNGENIEKRSKLAGLSWYSGPSLIEILDSLKVPPKDLNKPTRMTITTCYQSQTGKVKGNCLVGKIEGGILQKNTKYLIMPQGILTTIKDVYIDEEKTDLAKVVDTVTLVLPKDTDTVLLTPGNVLCSVAHPIPVAVKFKARIEVFEGDMPIIKGQRGALHIGLSKISAIFSKLNGILSKDKGEIVKKNPKCLKPGQFAEVEILCERKFCMEIFKNFSSYGRITMREKSKTIAAGIILEIIE